MYILCYYIYMEGIYRATTTTLSFVRYHLVFCARYRRKIFLIDGLEARFRELVTQICERNAFDIISLECNVDYCHLFVSVLPTVSPHEVVKEIKQGSAPVLLAEFPKLSKMPNLWTRNFLASTAEHLPQGDITEYVLLQRARG